MQRTIFISNINYNTSINEIFSLFVKAGPISKCFLLYDSNKRPSGRAVVQYTVDNAYSNLLSMNLMLYGHRLRIEPISQNKLFDIAEDENYLSIEQYFPYQPNDELYTQYYVEQPFSSSGRTERMKGIDVVKTLLKFKNVPVASNSENSKDIEQNSNNMQTTQPEIRKIQSSPMPNETSSIDHSKFTPSRRIDYDRRPERSYENSRLIDGESRDRRRDRSPRERSRSRDSDSSEYKYHEPYRNNSPEGYPPYSSNPQQNLGPSLNYPPDLYHMMNSNQYPRNQQLYELDMMTRLMGYQQGMPPQNNLSINRAQSQPMGQRASFDIPIHRSDMRDRDRDRRNRRDPRDRDKDREKMYDKERDRDYYHRRGY